MDLRSRMPNFDRYRDWQRPLPVSRIIVHHSGPGSTDERGMPTLTAEGMAQYQVEKEGRAHVAYHYVIDRAGTVYHLLDETIAGYHAHLPSPTNGADRKRWSDEWRNGQRLNLESVGILLLGWFDHGRRRGDVALPDDESSRPSSEQWVALQRLVREIRSRHQIPIARVQGHNEALTEADFGATGCPGAQFDVGALRRAIGGERIEVPKETGTLSVEGRAPDVPLERNRPLVGVHARNDHFFTETDWEIVRRARVESIKTMSFCDDSVYERARAIDPKMEFIVRLYPGGEGRGHVPPPSAFADLFRETIERLHKRFGVLKFEIHNEPNHLTGLEGWGMTREDAAAFEEWYLETFRILRERHPWALLGYPGLALPHNDLEWLEWNRKAIEVSDWLGCHPYWQSPPAMHEDPRFGRVYEQYHTRFPHKLIEITEFGNSNGQDPARTLTREQQRDEVVAWFKRLLQVPYVGAASGFIATSPDPRWAREGFTWGDDGGPFPVADAVGAIDRPPRRPDWFYQFTAKMPKQLPPDREVTIPVGLGNGGRHPWLAGGRARTFINVKWFGSDDREVGESLSVRLPQDFAPGDVAYFPITVRTPPAPGAYRLRLALYHNGHGMWFRKLDASTGPDFFKTLIGEAAIERPTTPERPSRPDLPEVAGRVTIVEPPPRVAAGGLGRVTVEATNSGRRAWRTDGEKQGSIRVGYHWLRAGAPRVEGVGRGILDGTVPTGASQKLTLPLRFPAEPGAYTLEVGLVSELEQWFGDVATLPITLAGGSYGVTYSAPLPEAMGLGEQRSIPVVLTNTGTLAWRAGGENPVTLAHHWLNAAGHSVQPTLRVPLASDVPPGEHVTLSLPLRAPADPGDYTLRLDLALEGRSFFSELGNPVLAHRVAVADAPAAPEWAAVWLLVESPSRLAAGEFAQIDTRVRNIGRSAWDRETVRIAYRLDDGPPRRVRLPADVPPGSEVALGLPLVSLAVGTHTLHVDLWREGVGWLEVAAQPRALTVLDAAGREVTPTPGDVPLEEVQVDPLVTPNGNAASHNAGEIMLAIDGDLETAWSSGEPQRPGMWVRFDLGALSTVRAVRLLARSPEHPRGYVLEGSTDGERWVRWAEAPASWRDLDVRLEPARPARYLRIIQTNHNPWHPWSIRELEIERDG